MNLAADVAAGMKFFVHKCTDGPQYYRDPYFAEAMRRAAAAGYEVRGAYHCLWNNNVALQMDWFLATIDAAVAGWRTGPFIIVLDCEPFSYNGGAPGFLTIQAAVNYLRTRVSAEVDIEVYAPQWVYGNSLTGVSAPLWASNYGGNPAIGFVSAYPGDSSARWGAYSGQVPAILQYGSSAVVGSQPTCDVNAIRDPAVWARISQGGAMSGVTADRFAVAFSQGIPTYTREDGATLSVEPVKWRKKDELFQAAIASAVDKALRRPNRPAAQQIPGTRRHGASRWRRGLSRAATRLAQERGSHVGGRGGPSVWPAAVRAGR